MTYDAHFWDVKPPLLTWPEVSAQLTKLKLEKIREGKVTGPYGQRLNGPPAPNGTVNVQGLAPSSLPHGMLPHPPPPDLSVVNSPSYIPGGHCMSAASVFAMELSNKDADEMSIMNVDSMGPQTMLAVIKRLQYLLIRKTIEVRSCLFKVPLHIFCVTC